MGAMVRNQCALCLHNGSGDFVTVTDYPDPVVTLNRGRPEKVEPLPSYKNAPRHKRVHSHIKMVKGAFLLAIPLAIKSNYSK